MLIGRNHLYHIYIIAEGSEERNEAENVKKACPQVLVLDGARGTHKIVIPCQDNLKTSTKIELLCTTKAVRCTLAFYFVYTQQKSYDVHLHFRYLRSAQHALFS